MVEDWCCERTVIVLWFALEEEMEIGKGPLGGGSNIQLEILNKPHGVPDPVERNVYLDSDCSLLEQI